MIRFSCTFNPKSHIALVTCKKNRFGLMAEMDRLVMVGHTKDLPGLIFHKRYKGSTHPFYAGFYQKAAKIDTRWADVMDTCIVK